MQPQLLCVGQLARRALRTAGGGELRLSEPVDWAAGSAVFVSSTAANGTMEEAETVIVSEVRDGGLTLVAASPLLYGHLGVTRPLAGGLSVDFRAHVGQQHGAKGVRSNTGKFYYFIAY